MRSHILHLLQINLHLHDYKYALLCFITAFVITLLTIPPIVTLIKRYKLYDMPNGRKEHKLPVPTMGGIAIMAGMIIALTLWFPFSNEIGQICFFFSIAVLFGLGIMDDLKDLSAKYKFVVQIGLAALIALAGIRITSFDGLFGINELSLSAQYSFTILAIVGITNAFNLIDGIDGLAGGLAFMSLVTLGLFLTLSGDNNTALIAFALAGAVFAFLYFNFNPAKIFMGDTGSLALGGLIGSVAVATKHEIVMAIIGGLFVMETMSVIIQVASFKLTGKRVFLMAPIHHHFEKLGWTESQVVIRFWIIAVILAMVGLSTLKLR